MEKETEIEKKPTLARRVMKRAIRLLWSLVFIVGSVAIFLSCYQHKMIYFPRQYDAEDYAGAPDSMVELEFSTSQGKQVAFYVPPREGDPGAMPQSVWAVFSGNASSALDWRFFVNHYPDARTGFLLVDYPGYGKCEGTARPSRIRENGNGAVAALDKHLSAKPGALDGRINVIGHSLGAAASLHLATSRPVNGAVLIAPFTSMRSMAARTVGYPMAYILHHNYDNRARLNELARRDRRPRVIIIHGDQDEIIPLSMGEKVAAEHPEMVDFRPAKGGDHNAIMDFFERDIYAAMAEVEKPLFE